MFRALLRHGGPADVDPLERGPALQLCERRIVHASASFQAKLCDGQSGQLREPARDESVGQIEKRQPREGRDVRPDAIIDRAFADSQ